jgi:hypothetical protein
MVKEGAYASLHARQFGSARRAPARTGSTPEWVS